MTDERRTRLAAERGRVKRLHVSQPHIRHNIRAPEAERKPPIIVQTSAGPLYGWDVEIDGPSRLVWGEKPLGCGARVWLETQSPVRVVSEDTDARESAAEAARTLADMLEALDGHLEATQALALLAGVEALEQIASGGRQPTWCPV